MVCVGAKILDDWAAEFMKIKYFSVYVIAAYYHCEVKKQIRQSGEGALIRCVTYSRCYFRFLHLVLSQPRVRFSISD